MEKDTTDTTVSLKDIEQLHQQVNEQGFLPMVVELFQNEPALAGRFGLLWGSVRDKLIAMGLNEKQVLSVMKSVARLAAETLILQRRGQRRLWDDFLPPSDEAEGGHHG